jgi:hypothetical protein
MKTKAKRFDCVKMKNDIQARMLRQYAGWSDEEREADIRRRLAESKSPVGRLWRKLTSQQAVSKVAETPATYAAKRKK